MRYINNDQEIQQNIPSVVTVGKFDGFHRGHQKLLQRAAELRGEECQVVLFTFSRSPQMVLANKMGAGLNTHDEKMELISTLNESQENLKLAQMLQANAEKKVLQLEESKQEPVEPMQEVVEPDEPPKGFWARIFKK